MTLGASHGGVMRLAATVASTMLCASLAAPEVRADGAERRTAGSPGLPSQGWTGFYAGGHLGYAAATSDWTATSLGAPAVAAGSFDFAHGYDAFKGTGSYFGGFQTGYNYRLPSGIVLGVEADVSAPNKITDTKTITSPAVGQASYHRHSGDVPAACAAGSATCTHDGLLYGTAGYAWSYDHFLRTQLAGTPVGGTAVPGTAEKIERVAQRLDRRRRASRCRLRRAGLHLSNICSRPSARRA